MADIHAGVVTMSRDDMARFVKLQDKERVMLIQINRRGNPPFLMFDTTLGKARHTLQLVALGLAMHLPPMHQIVDVWFAGSVCFLLVTGAKLPLVRHGQQIEDVPFSVDTIEAKPGRPAYRAGKFAA